MTNNASKLVSDAIIGEDYITVFVNGKAYLILPPTIKRLAGAISCLSELDLGDTGTLKDIFLASKDCEAYARALSWLIKGNASLSDELSNGTLEEVVDALEKAFGLVDVTPFLKAASLTRSASLLAASPR